ncbi:MAG: alpha/beta hydrolase [Asticcacaulis sp.]
MPFAVLKLLSGGSIVHINGRTLDTQIQFLRQVVLARSGGRVPLSLAGGSLEGVREDWTDTAALTAYSSKKIKVESVGSDTVTGRLVRPDTPDPEAPLLVLLHEGGGVLGGTDLSLAFASVFAEETRFPMFLPDYRLAPAHRFPAAFDDAHNAFVWAQANAARLGAASGAVALGGISMGANIAARLCLDLKRDFKPLPVAQLLISPLLDLADPEIRQSPYAQSWPIGAADIEIMIGHYAGAGLSLTDPALSPLREKLIIGQPDTLVIAAGLDPLATQAEAYVQRLSDARTKVVYRRYDTLPCGFTLFAGLVDHAEKATRDIARTFVSLIRG